MADALTGAARSGLPCPPVRDLLGPGGIDAAYAVQLLLTERATAEGRRAVGRKVGLTSPAVQAQLGVDRPDFGVLFADMAVPSGAVVSMSRLLQPRIEAEVAFVLGADLDGAITESTVRDSVAGVVPALEIVDSRIAGWDISLLDTVADNASCGLYVLGEEEVPLGRRDLREVTMTMVDGSGAVVSAGSGADCLGDPVLAVAWLARTAQALGAPLCAGDVVLSGALGPMVTVTPGSRFEARLVGLGTVGVGFGPSPSAAGDIGG